MKICVICFSQTGNTRKIAESIASGITDAGAVCELIRFEDVSVSDLAAFDRVGLGCPVFYYREPMHIRKWLSGLADRKGQPWFVFCTHGNVIGKFFPSITHLLTVKGAAIIGCFHSYASIHIPFLPSPGFTEGHPDEKDLATAEVFGRQMTHPDTEFLERSAVPGPVSSRKWMKEAEKFSAGFLEKTMPKVMWDVKSCSACRTCMEQCPVSGIDLDASPPRLQRPCIYCWNCVVQCPEGALSADWRRLIALAPSYFASCRIELDRMAESGDFRWLIEPDTVDTKDVFIFNRFRRSY